MPLQLRVDLDRHLGARAVRTLLPALNFGGESLLQLQHCWRGEILEQQRQVSATEFHGSAICMLHA